MKKRYLESLTGIAVNAIGTGERGDKTLKIFVIGLDDFNALACKSYGFGSTHQRVARNGLRELEGDDYLALSNWKGFALDLGQQMCHSSEGPGPHPSPAFR